MGKTARATARKYWMNLIGYQMVLNVVKEFLSKHNQKARNQAMIRTSQAAKTDTKSERFHAFLEWNLLLCCNSNIHKPSMPVSGKHFPMPIS